MELSRLKVLLGIPDTDHTQDDSLQFLLADVEETIRNYCGLDRVPEGLFCTACRMALDLYRYDRPGDGSSPVTVTSISEGDTSASFADAAKALDGGILKDYQGQLNSYRKLRW